MPQYSAPLVIAGFHRSGTSMLANLFHDAGLFLGDDLLGGKFSNKYGHFEDRTVIGFHDRLLAQSGASWQHGSAFIPTVTREDWYWLAEYGIARSVHGAWGVKDPRVCLFLPQWAEVFPAMSVLYLFRSCAECVGSLKRRAAADLARGHAPAVNIRFWTEPDLAIRMYLTYARAALRFLESFPGRSCVVSLDSLLAGRDILGELRETWRYPLAPLEVGDVFEAGLMKRAGPNEAVADPALLAEVRQVEARLRARERMGFVGPEGR